MYIESCKLGLFQGSNGKFKPQNQLTNAQAITVLVRLLAENQSEVWLSHRADNYYSKANELGVLQNVSMNSKNNTATRGNVGIVIYNGKAGNIKKEGKTQSKELKIIDNWRFGLQDEKWLCNSKWNNKDIRKKTATNINTKLQNSRDKWQQLTQQYLSEAYKSASQNTGNITQLCEDSLLINILENQRGYITSYTTKDGETTIGIDFFSLNPDLSNTYYTDPNMWEMRDDRSNTSKKVRYYKLSAENKLQTITQSWASTYISNFNTWINQYCNGEPLYNIAKEFGYDTTSTYDDTNGYDDINWSDNSTHNYNTIRERDEKYEHRSPQSYNSKSPTSFLYCTKDMIKDNGDAYFSFDNKGYIKTIDVNRRDFSFHP